LPVFLDGEVVEPADGIAIIHMGWQAIHTKFIHLIIAILQDFNISINLTRLVFLDLEFPVAVFLNLAGNDNFVLPHHFYLLS